MGYIALLAVSFFILGPKKDNMDFILGYTVLVAGTLWVGSYRVSDTIHTFYEEGNRVEISVMNCDGEDNFLSTSLKHYKGEDLQGCWDIKIF